MENKNNQRFNMNESDELNKLKILNSALINELRKYKEENMTLKHHNEILNCIIENLEEENKTLKSDFSSMKNQNPHEETMDIVENIFQSNHAIKEEPLDFYHDHTNNESYNDGMDLASIQSLQDSNYKCHSCGKSFSHEQNLKKHSHEILHTVHEASKDHKCESCGKSFSEGRKLKKHIQRVHNNKRMNVALSLQLTKFKCEICKKEITGNHNFKVHMENVHEELKKYECDKCGKNFAQNIGLKTHITAVHEKIKRFNCDQCGKTFSRGCDLKVHIQIVHEKVFEHICDDCGKNFTKAFNLKRHVQNIHEKKGKEIIQSLN